MLKFGIDIVMIEPGTVNTSMYDKGEKKLLSEFKQTEYWEAVQNFQKWIVNEARANGLLYTGVWAKPSIWHSARQNLRRTTPGRYPQRFKNWTLLGLIPVADCSISTLSAKQMGLKK